MTDYLIGIDGGGTKTLALLADSNGNILARGVGGPSNYNAVGFESACASIEAAISQVLPSVSNIRFSALSVVDSVSSVANSVSALCLGLAGAGRPEDRDKFHAWAVERFPQTKVQVVSDAEILLAAGAPTGAALALICGTGSIVYGRTANGELLRAGGWGYLFGDEGSGFALGAAALRAVMRAYDGRGATTLLADLILEWRNLDNPQGLVKSIYGAESPRTEIASLSGLVEQAASQADPIALAILDEAALELAHTLQTVYRKLGNSPVPLALTGGVILHNVHFAAKFHQACQNLGLEFSAIQEVPEPAVGAVRLAQKLIT
jgi:N-acetylglucosamine kinase-like BadF-type ATPase